MTLPKKPAPYTFVPVVTDNNTASPGFSAIFHDTKQGLTGELNCELTTLTPMMVGHYQYKYGDKKRGEIFIEQGIDNNKNVLEPLFLNNTYASPMLITGSTLKGMVRHNIGAMLAAPMERVQEQFFSYRPNLDWNKNPSKYYCKEAIIEDIKDDGSIDIAIIKKGARNAVFRSNRKKHHLNYTEHPYIGGVDDGTRLNITPNGKTFTYTKAWLPSNIATTIANIPAKIVEQYNNTQDELANLELGHISRRVDIKKDSERKEAHKAVLATKNLQNKQLIYVEVDENNNVVSFGHNFRYRWRYADSILEKSGSLRKDVTQTSQESIGKDNQDDRLTGARLLFGYVDGDENDKNKENRLKIGKEGSDYVRLAGRISINTAVEQCDDFSNLDQRFVRYSKANDNIPTEQRYTIPLKILGGPQASAVEHYLQQNSNKLQTYGDLPGVETSTSQLNGRKFYRHQPVTDNKPFEETVNDKINKDQSSLARFICKENTTFRFKVRFKNLHEWELGALILALSPQLKDPKAANKLGHGRPLGLGSIRINVNEIKILNNNQVLNTDTKKVTDYIKCLEKQESVDSKQIQSWLKVLNYEDRKPADYPRGKKGEIFNYHTEIRRQYSKNRRNKNGQMDANYGDPVKP